LGFCVGDCYSLPLSDRVHYVPVCQFPPMREWKQGLS
jgi:hypothetical protein